MNAKIHEGKAGEVLWDRCIELGIETRKKLREFGRYYARTGRTAEERWFFDPFVPDFVTSARGVTRATIVSDVALGRRADRGDQARAAMLELRPAAGRGTAIKGYAAGYAMVDPNKLTLLTPGIDRETGDYLDFGVPATVVANYLREQRIVPEKCDLNSILFLMTPAEDESKLNTLIAKLVKFKDLWDRDAPLDEVLPTLYAAHQRTLSRATRCGRSATRCTTSTATRDIKELQRLCFRASSFPELAMSPKDAYEALVGQRRGLRAAGRRSRAASPRRSR